MIDMMILNFIDKNLHTRIGDIFFANITKIGNGGIIWIILALMLIFYTKERKVGFAAILSLLLVLIICLMIMKPLVARERPFENFSNYFLLIKKPTDYSFPSGHAASSFALISVLYFYKHRWFKYTLVLALILSFSRLYLFVHYPSDVFWGAVFGIAFGYFSYRLTNRLFDRLEVDR